MRADFYLIRKPRFREQPLLLVCKLVEKALLSEQPLHILVRDQDQAEALDDLLWAYDEDVFIPHQIAGQDDDDEVPVLIAAPGTSVAGARPLCINLRNDIPTGGYQRVLEVVPADPAQRDSSRARWRQYRDQGANLNKYDM